MGDIFIFSSSDYYCFVCIYIRTEKKTFFDKKDGADCYRFYKISKLTTIWDDFFNYLSVPKMYPP